MTGISRRDFVNGLLVTPAAFGLSASPGASASADDSALQSSNVLNDPRFLRSGNLPATFNVAHWLRDGRLTFTANAVTLAPGEDGDEGSHSIIDDDTEFDLIVVGAGLAGLSAAYYVLQEQPSARILLLEANGYAGGNAARDSGNGLPVVASSGGAFSARPYGFLTALYRELGMDWEKYLIDTQDSFYFDEHTPGVKPGYRQWVGGDELFEPEKIHQGPYSLPVMHDLLETEKTLTDWGEISGGPDDPPDRSDPRYDDLSTITLADYLVRHLHCDPCVADFYSCYTIDCMGGMPQYVSAHSALSFLTTEQGSNTFAFPGGTSETALRLVRHITQATRTKDGGRPASIVLGAVALRVETDANTERGVGVTYYKDGTFRRAKSAQLVLATQSSSTRPLINHLLDQERRAAWRELRTVPSVIANVALRTLVPFAKPDLGYANFYWGGRHFSNFEIADWTTSNRRHWQRASALTFYGAIRVPPEGIAAERMKLLHTPFKDYENSLREDLGRVMQNTGFDFDRDVSGIYVYRWGHSMILPSTTSLFGSVRGPDGRLDRSKAPRRIAARPLGPISFAGQYTEGAPSVESAISSGRRAAHEVLARL